MKNIAYGLRITARENGEIEFYEMYSNPDKYGALTPRSLDISMNGKPVVASITNQGDVKLLTFKNGDMEIAFQLHPKDKRLPPLSDYICSSRIFFI